MDATLDRRHTDCRSILGPQVADSSDILKTPCKGTFTGKLDSCIRLPYRQQFQMLSVEEAVVRDKSRTEQRAGKEEEDRRQKETPSPVRKYTL